MDTETLFKLPDLTTDDISTIIFNRLQLLSRQKDLINVFSFDFNSTEVLGATAMRLAYAEKYFNDMYITDSQLSTTKDNYIIYIKLNLCYKLAMANMSIDDYNRLNNCKSKFNNGEVWDIYVTSIQNVIDIFLPINSSNCFNDLFRDPPELYFDEKNLFYN